MASEDDDEYYNYSDEDGYSVEEDDSNMEWESNDNPNAAPMQYKVSSSTAGLKSGIRMMRAEDLRPVMVRRLTETQEVLGVPAAAAGVLLREYGWSKEALLEDYYNAQSADKIMKKAGVFHRCGHVIACPKSKDCAICYDDDCGDANMLGMPCGHAFCRDCWFDFCNNAIEEGPSCVRTTCPEATCAEVVTEDEMAKALHGREQGAEKLAKFQTYQLRSFVESNALTRWCPGRGCERVACAESASAMEAEGNIAHCDSPSCLLDFCLICGEEPHAPSTCKDLARWNEKCRNESETANWILANTKSCPKCVSRIEKNQGCNHMTCQRCKFEFCWICMGDWHDHGANTGGYYKCNKYDTGAGMSGDNGDDQSDAARAKRDLDRYLHYYKRYHAHAEAQTFAKKQLKETESRMVLLQESSDDAKWSDVEFLKTANEQLVECRRVLKYTYVFAYYLDPGLQQQQGKASSSSSSSSSSANNNVNANNAMMQRERFEHHQEMLERFTENLSELSEKPIQEMDRTDVVNQTRVVDRFMKNILKYVEDGMDEV